MGKGSNTYEVNHVHHCRVAGDEQEEGNLHGVRLAKIPLVNLLHAELADQVVLGLLGAGVYKTSEVFEEFPGPCQQIVHPRGYGIRRDVVRGGRIYSFAACASRAVELPFVRTAFWFVRYSRSSNGTPRMV